jgi:endoglucanase
MKSKVIASVDAAIACDMYVIIDWHILSDGNPQTYKSEAKAFFSEMAERYKDSPNVIYEVCNEPNGNVSWEKDIKPYEEELVSTIRAHSPKAIILLGSSTWSQDIDLAAKSPVSGSNLMYTLHFYAGIHGSELRRKLDSALSSGLPIFISEWGTSRADGGGGVYSEETETWLSFLNKRGISWCSWSLCDKNESSAALNPGASPTSWSEADLSASGKIVFSHFKDGTN